jgi:RNA polymerase sigma-70 factor (ECF subfamily)
MESVQRAENLFSQDWISERYDFYKSTLFRIAFSYTGNKYDSEDILQEAFIKLLYHAPDFLSDEDEKRWIIRVTINLCKNHLRSFWHKNRSNIEDIEQYVAAEEDRTQLLEILNLPAKYKIVIHLYYYEGYHIAEIAQILKLSISAIKMRLKRGREILKIELEGYYERQ